MFRVDLEDITEKDLISLQQDQIPESLTIEFKRGLDLASRQEKAEAAKNVSAMANTIGGRIFYGLDEEALADGSVVAGNVCPLTDGTLDTRVEDVLLSSIHPRPRFRTRKVPVNNNAGFVLVVEVYPAYASDLHMVTGFKESRFYRRGEQRTVLMTEPEVRECYMRIAASRQALDAQMEAAVDVELALVPTTHESVFVIPWFGHQDLVNPRLFGSRLGVELHNGPIANGRWSSVVENLEVVSDGYRGFRPSDGQLHDCRQYASVRRTGLAHFADALAWEQNQPAARVMLHDTLEMLAATLVTARMSSTNALIGAPYG